MDFAGRSWHWRQEVTATQIPGVVRIDVKVRPADVKAGDDNGWFTTVSGIQGDAVAVPNGYLPDWGSQVLPGQAMQAGLSGHATAGHPRLGPGHVSHHRQLLDAGRPGDARRLEQPGRLEQPRRLEHARRRR